jgi:3-oxoacyl-[acyl-carrier-protein] synthase-3
MAFLHIPNVSIKGISACVPKNILENKQYSGFTGVESDAIIAAIGIERHRIAGKEVCTSDLCFHAAERLINDLNWARSDIDCLVFVSQTPDYILPATSCLLQNRLGLNEEVAALDITLGCSGWVYGLQVLSSLLSHGYQRKGLLLVGDTTLKFCSPEDKSTFPLFGDAGTATALEYDKSDPGFNFHSATDGSGYEAIIIPDGGFRNQASESSFEMVEIKPGIKRNKLQVILDGMNVLSFSISRAPESINMLSERFNIDLGQVDYFLFHQANKFINERIRNKLKLPVEKVPYSLKNYGNTGPGTIPLTMVTEIGQDLHKNKRNIIACGFGVGLSWGSVYFFTENIICSELFEL